jgi:hypothetical protein
MAGRHEAVDERRGLGGEAIGGRFVGCGGEAAAGQRAEKTRRNSRQGRLRCRPRRHSNGWRSPDHRKSTRRVLRPITKPRSSPALTSQGAGERAGSSMRGNKRTAPWCRHNPYFPGHARSGRSIYSFQAAAASGWPWQQGREQALHLSHQRSFGSYRPRPDATGAAVRFEAVDNVVTSEPNGRSCGGRNPAGRRGARSDPK